MWCQVKTYRSAHFFICFAEGPASSSSDYSFSSVGCFSPWSVEAALLSDICLNWQKSDEKMHFVTQWSEIARGLLISPAQRPNDGCISSHNTRAHWSIPGFWYQHPLDGARFPHNEGFHSQASVFCIGHFGRPIAPCWPNFGCWTRLRDSCLHVGWKWQIQMEWWLPGIAEN